MTIDEFLVRLEAVDRQWHTVGWIRTKGDCHQWHTVGWIRTKVDCHQTYCCPLTAVAGMSQLSDWQKAGESLGLAAKDARAIAAAADRWADYDPALRARLLEAVGLKEPTP